MSKTALRFQLSEGYIDVVLHPDGSVELVQWGNKILLSTEEAKELIGRVALHHSELDD